MELLQLEPRYRGDRRSDSGAGDGPGLPTAVEAPARWRFHPQSLRFKVTVGVTVILIAAMGVVFALQYRWFQQEMIERLGLSSTPLSDVIKGSLKHAMQTRDLSEVRAIIDNVSRQPGVIKVFVVDKRGEIHFSPDPRDIGTRVGVGEATCQICHRVQPENRSKTVIFTGPGGERVFRNVNPIANEAACFGCHRREDKLNGVLISDFSMAETDRQLAGKLREMLLALLLAAGASAVTITVIMNRLVIGKLERFVQATKLLGKGKLDLRVEARPRDEIGELAVSFNSMVESLRRAKDLRERTELLESVLDNVDDAVIVFAPDGTILAWNHASERAFGLDAAQAVGAERPLLGEDQEALLARARDEGRLDVERRLRSADGRYLPARVHVVPLRDERAGALGCVAIVQDLTEEMVKARLQEQLRHSEKLAAVGRLAAGVAHELNNPLGNVLLHSKLLLEDCRSDDPRHGTALRIVDNTLRCKMIVRGLLDYAKESGVEMAWTDLNAAMEQSVGLVAGHLRSHGVECRLELDPALPRVRCDGRQIQQVMVNLLENAIEAMDGGGMVTLSTRLGDEGKTVVVTVRDEGCGIPAECLSRVFEPFYTTKAQGTGLGLSISYGIVEVHHGRIWAESRADGPEPGTTFFVTLPLAAEAPA